jgi:AbrB family looped-hinge helix DNA binding protein
MPSAKLTSKGQITLPKPVREQLHLRPGDRVNFVIDGAGEIRDAHRPGDARFKGLLHRPGRKPVTLEQMDAAGARGCSKVIGLDTNVLVRYLTQDDAAQARS